MSDDYLRKNIRLYPDAEQNSTFFRYAGAMRWAYNEAKAISDRFYKKTGKTLPARQIRYLIRQERDHIPDYSWLSEIPYHITVRQESIFSGKSLRLPSLSQKTGPVRLFTKGQTTTAGLTETISRFRELKSL